MTVVEGVYIFDVCCREPLKQVEETYEHQSFKKDDRLELRSTMLHPDKGEQEKGHTNPLSISGRDSTLKRI